MRQKLPYLRVPIVRYYSVHLHIHNQIHSAFNGNVFATFAQTEYSQLLLAELSLDQVPEKTAARPPGKLQRHVEDFVTSDKFTIDLDDHSTLEIRILECRSPATDIVLADLSEELIECFELLYLFLKGIIFPAIHKLQMLIDSGLTAVVPLREMLSRVLPDKLKVNILAEYQLMNFDEKPDDFIDFNLIWFLGKMDLPSVEKFMQEEEIRLDEEAADAARNGSEPEDDDEFEGGESSFELPESSEPFEASSEAGLTEHDRQIKTEFENELKRFYLDEPRFFTRVVGIRHYTVDMGQLGEGTRVMLTPEPENPHDLFAVAVRTKEGQMIGYLKKELSEIMYPEIRKGILFRATVVKVLPEIVDSNSRVHLMIEKIMYHFN